MSWNFTWCNTLIQRNFFGARPCNFKNFISLGHASNYCRLIGMYARNNDMAVTESLSADDGGGTIWWRPLRRCDVVVCRVQFEQRRGHLGVLAVPGEDVITALCEETRPTDWHTPRVNHVLTTCKPRVNHAWVTALLWQPYFGKWQCYFNIFLIISSGHCKK